MNNYPPDLERFRATSAMPDPTPAPRSPIRSQRVKFLKGPIPWDWVTRAANLPGKALIVGLELWRESGCRKSSAVQVSLRGMKSLGVGRNAVAASLTRLEQAGLINVERRRGRAPRVTIQPKAL